MTNFLQTTLSNSLSFVDMVVLCSYEPNWKHAVLNLQYCHLKKTQHNFNSLPRYQSSTHWEQLTSSLRKGSFFIENLLINDKKLK